MSHLRSKFFTLSIALLVAITALPAAAAPIVEWPTFRNTQSKIIVVAWISPQDLQGFRLSTIFKKLEKRFKGPSFTFSFAVSEEPGFALDETAAREYIDRINWKESWFFDASGIEAKSNHVTALPTILVTGPNLKQATVMAGKISFSDLEKALARLAKEQNIAAPTGKEISIEGDYSGCFQSETTLMGQKRFQILGDLKPQIDSHWVEKENFLRSEKNKKSRLSFDFSGTTLGLISQSTVTNSPAHISATVDNLKPLIFNVGKLRVYELASKLPSGSHRMTLEVQGGLDLYGLQSLNACPD